MEPEILRMLREVGPLEGEFRISHLLSDLLLGIHQVSLGEKVTILR
jgi:hypothetical protein